MRVNSNLIRLLIFHARTVVAISCSCVNSRRILRCAVPVASVGLNGFRDPLQIDFRKSPPLNLHQLSNLLKESTLNPQSQPLAHFSAVATVARFLACSITWSGLSAILKLSRER